MKKIAQIESKLTELFAQLSKDNIKIPDNLKPLCLEIFQYNVLFLRNVSGLLTIGRPFTQPEFGKKLLISLSSIRRWEDGDKLPHKNNTQSICNFIQDTTNIKITHNHLICKNISHLIAYEKLKDQSLPIQDFLGRHVSILHTLIACENKAELLDKLLALFIEHSDLDSGGIYLFENDELVLQNSVNLSKAFTDYTRRYPANSPQYHLVKGGIPIFMPHSSIEPLFNELKKIENLKYIAVLPLKHDANIYGSIYLASHSGTETKHAHRLEYLSLTLGAAIYQLMIKLS